MPRPARPRRFIMCGVIIIAAVMYFVERGSFACPCSMPAKLRQESVECADIPCEPNSDTGVRSPGPSRAALRSRRRRVVS